MVDFSYLHVKGIGIPSILIMLFLPVGCSFVYN